MTPRARAVSVSSTRVPSSATAPTASSGFCGAPSLRTVRTSSGASRARAISCATGTPPRGSAIDDRSCSGQRPESGGQPASGITAIDEDHVPSVTRPMRSAIRDIPHHAG